MRFLSAVLIAFVKYLPTFLPLHVALTAGYSNKFAKFYFSTGSGVVHKLNALHAVTAVTESLFKLVNLFSSGDDSALIEEAKQHHAREMALIERESKERTAHFANLMQELEQLTQENQRSLANLFGTKEERRPRADYVNKLKLHVRVTDTILLVGPKGMGKSTFLWLLGEGDKPRLSLSDGTTDVTQRGKFIDTMGLNAWTIEEFVKLLVLFLYRGFPRDLIVFTNGKVAHPISTLALAGIKNPMVVILSSTFWRSFNKGHITLTRDNSSRIQQVSQMSDLEEIYHEELYCAVRSLGMGTPVTHRNITEISEKRARASILPFQNLLGRLPKGQYVVDPNNSENEISELLFRFIYIYDKIYARDAASFMSRGKQQDFMQ